MFGSHLSIAGNMANALREAERLGFETVQVFTKNQRQWRVKPLEDAAREEWLSELARLGWEGRTVSHNSYLINMASPDDALREKSIALQREEIERCAALSIPYLVWHPGSHMGSGVEAGIERVAQACARLLRETEDLSGAGPGVTLCIENTVGSGAHLGGPWEHLRDMREAIVALAPRGSASRVGFCIDTCHAHAFGHDMSTEAKARAALDALDKVAGLEHVKVLHLNDSKGACGSRLDRHEHVGEGTIGLEGFRAVVNHPALARIPKILETPKEDTPKGTPWDTVNLRRLRRMIRDEPASSGDAAPVTPRRGRRAAAGR